MKKRQITSIKDRFLNLVILNIVLILVASLITALIFANIYHKQIDSQLENSYSAIFFSIENTLSVIDNIAYNIMSDQTVVTTLGLEKADNRERYLIVDDITKTLITNSLIANDAIEITVGDRYGNFYHSGTDHYRITEEDQATLYEEGKSLSPVWMYDENTGNLVYNKLIYPSMYAWQNPIGSISIFIDLDKIISTQIESMEDKNILLLYEDEVLISLNDTYVTVTQKESYQEILNGAYFQIQKTTNFNDLALLGYATHGVYGSFAQYIWIIGLYILGAIPVLFFIYRKLTIDIQTPISDLIARMNDPKTTISEAVADTQYAIQELNDLSENFDTMSSRIEYLLCQNYYKGLNEKKYKIQALQSQINPHFLYNTLDSIHWLAKTGNNENVSIMVQSLASLFRESTKYEGYIVSLKEEMHILASYNTIQQIRYEERIDIQIEVAKEHLDLKIPKLSLQPIVENAIKYGYEEIQSDSLHVTIESHFDGDNMTIDIYNNGPPFPPEVLESINSYEYAATSGLGLVNIKSRLKALFGEEAKLVIRSNAEQGTLVKLIIPQK